ncbi:DHHA1 domain-containing protein, partial [Candidatus Bathyarchaeota archaeon]|nr:DHHA1 domain-containing protein [Candidatus Bathyarchaeota archaeon]
DVDRMVQTANEIIKRDESVIAIFYGSDSKNARIMVMAGKTALGKGADAGQAVREASSIIGGGGGGKPNFAQGGGTRTDKLPEALRRAEEILRKKLGSK